MSHPGASGLSFQIRMQRIALLSDIAELPPHYGTPQGVPSRLATRHRPGQRGGRCGVRCASSVPEGGVYSANDWKNQLQRGAVKNI